MKFLLLFVLLFRIKKIYSFSGKEILENVNLYINELCSYNGIPTINTTTNEVVCECKERYTNEPRKNKIKYINGHMIQCSYERKSRFYTVFLALCIPFGFDFLYIKRYLAFSISLFMSSITIVLVCKLFILSYRINLKTNETRIQIRLNKMTNKVHEKNNLEDNKSYEILVILCKFFSISHILYIIVVLVLHLSGKITDGNNIETENDLTYLFTSPD